MTQNRSSAVMAQRRSPPKALDYFPTPPWATRALLETVNLRAPEMRPWTSLTTWEPACGEGHMARVLAEYFGRVVASDVFDYGIGAPVHDFLAADDLAAAPPPIARPDVIITNPPFSCAQAFVERAVAMAEHAVAVLVRTAFLESAERYAFFQRCPPWVVAQFAGRVPMVMGRLDPAASSATAYCWIVWHCGLLRHFADRPQAIDTHLQWIAPDARARWERPGDYPAAPAAEGALL